MLPSAKRSLFLLWLSHLVLDFFTGIWPIYKTMTQIDLRVAGLLTGASGFLGEFSQLLFGYLCDQGHRKRVLMCGLLLSCAMVGVTFCHTAIGFFPLLLLLMIGSAAFHPAGAGFATLLSSEHIGRNLMIFASGGALGLAISQVAFTRLHAFFGGQVLILVLPVIAMLLLLYFHHFPQGEERAPPLSFKEFVLSFSKCRGPLLFLYVAQVTNHMLAASFLFLLPDLLITRVVGPTLYMGVGHLCYVTGAALSMLLVGTLCDRYGYKRVLLSMISTSLVLLYAFLTNVSLSLVPTILVLISLGATLGTISSTLVSWGNRLVPDRPSTVSAIMMGSAWCVASLGPALAGTLAKAFRVDGVLSAILCMSILPLFALLFIFLVPKAPSPAVQVIPPNHDKTL